MVALRLAVVLWLTAVPQAALAQTSTSAPATVPSSTAPSAPAVEASKSSAVPSEASPAPPPGTPLTADQIMARVAANQDRAEALRSEYIYHQRVRVLLQKANGTRMRDVTSEYTVTPTPDGTKKDLVHVEGYYRHKGRYIAFQGKEAPPSAQGGISVRLGDEDSIDGDMAQDFRDDLTNDKSKDGLAKDLFPLTTENQKDYRFQLLGQEVIHGRPTYRLKFGPKDRSDIDWAGEADIDAADFEPVRVYTKLSRPIPFLIRKFLVDLPGVGFNVEYGRQSDGVWFPVSFGTEFRVRVLMFWARNVIVSMSNTDFQHAQVAHTIRFEGTAPARPEVAAIPISISQLSFLDDPGRATGSGDDLTPPRALGRPLPIRQVPPERRRLPPPRHSIDRLC